MKKIVFYLVFFLICVNLVIPPLFYNPATDVNLNINFNLDYSKLVLFVFSIVIFLFYEFSRRNYNFKLINILLDIGKILFCFGILISLNCVNVLVAWLVTGKINLKIDFIKTPLTILFAFIRFFISAFYEETLYRLYLPESLQFMTNSFCNHFFFSKSESFKKNFCFFINGIFEVCCILIFAFSHLYLGRVAVFNALMAGIVLRIFAVKNKTIIIGTMSHFLYNSFIFLATILI